MPVLAPRAGSHTAPQQHSQPSRKGRKAWRKNVDVSEVEKGLEERNNEIIKGGLVKEQQSDELFQIEDEGDLEVAKRLAKKYTKGLKADEIIAQRSAVPVVSGRKRAGETSKTTDGVLPTKRQRTNYVLQKEVIRLRKVADGHHETTVAIAEANYDPWAVPAPEAVAAPDADDDPFSFLPKPQAIKAPDTLKQAPVSLAANGKPIPALAKPKGAFSYNPSFTDYEARLTEEGSKAVEAERKLLAAAEAERVRLEAVARSAAEADAAEARAELSEWDEDSAWEGFESGVEDDAAAKRPKRKTPAQRNRAKRRKEAEARQRHEAIQRRKEEQAKDMERLVAEAQAAREKALALAAAGSSSDGSDDDDDEDKKVGDDNVLRRRRLGKARLPEKDLELVLPDELQDSLRLLKPEGNLLKDRYRNLLVRGKVEARTRRPFRKQAKGKITEKWAHKDFQLF
ncbi:p60 domain containing protein [Niveomyces insectorum RCEF 264]|uniref:Ribosome biogenesis protein NOP53 n=1 Tax=Niveomyces insectorum RCEF 264 TaxID=1081102 RepID=A0A162MQ18_9HYPO|nr:p60 domain containing protein [Niveomyces insectorum RCEF 264]